MTQSNSNWRDKLPDGFQPIYMSSKPSISFDAKHNRFYFTSAALADLGLRKGDRIGMAYNKSDDTIIIVKSGGSMFIDKSSYVTSSHFAHITGHKTGLIEYEYIPEESNDEFKFFRRVNND